MCFISVLFFFIWMFFHLRGRKETQKHLWWVWVSCFSHVPTQPLTLIQFSGLWGCRCLERNSWCCAGIAQPQQKHCFTHHCKAQRCCEESELHPPSQIQCNTEISQPIYCSNKMLTKMLEVYLQDEKKKASQVHNWTLMKAELFSIIWLDS